MANGRTGFTGTWETLPFPSQCRLETRLTNSKLIRGPLHRPRKIHRASNDDARDALSSGATRLMLRPRY